MTSTAPRARPNTRPTSVNAAQNRASDECADPAGDQQRTISATRNTTAKATGSTEVRVAEPCWNGGRAEAASRAYKDGADPAARPQHLAHQPAHEGKQRRDRTVTPRKTRSTQVIARPNFRQPLWRAERASRASHVPDRIVRLEGRDQIGHMTDLRQRSPSGAGGRPPRATRRGRAPAKPSFCASLSRDSAWATWRTSPDRPTSPK